MIILVVGIFYKQIWQHDFYLIPWQVWGSGSDSGCDNGLFQFREENWGKEVAMQWSLWQIKICQINVASYSIVC